MYPSAVPMVDYDVADLSDGAGPRIVAWNVDTMGAQPTAEQLAAGEAAMHESEPQAISDADAVQYFVMKGAANG
jgi:hypothetical protein